MIDRAISAIPGALLLVVLSAAVGRAEDPKESAKKAIARAKEHHKAGKLDEALKELTLAYALDPQKDLLYGIAQLHVKLGQCPEAITFYRRYIAAKPAADSTSKAQQAIDACEKNPPPKPQPPEPAEPVTPPANPPPVVVTPVAPTPPPVVVRSTPWYTDVLGDALVGGGLIAGVASIVLYRKAVSTRDDADSAPTYPEYLDKLDSARGTRTLAVIAGAAGGALIVGGVIRFATRSSTTEARVTVAPLPGGGMVAWSGRL